MKKLLYRLFVRPFQAGVHKALQGKTDFRHRECQSLEAHIADTTVSDDQVRSEFQEYCRNYNPESSQVKHLLIKIVRNRPLLAESILAQVKN